MSKKAKSTTWADVSKGQSVELAGRAWRVTKIKPDGKRAKVTVEHKGREAKSVVKLKDAVTIVSAAAAPTWKKGGKRGPVTDERGTQQRWATEKELREAMTQGLPPGDQSQTKPPAKANGDPWETQADRVERKLDEILQARLVAISTDKTGYYVPPVDSSTIAAHLALLHGGIPEACDDDESKMLRAHDAQHAAALKGEGVLEVNHWHTEKRPKI